MNKTDLVKLFNNIIESPINGKSNDCLRVATYNVNMWKNAELKNNITAIFNTINNIQADIICLNEALFFNNNKFTLSMFDKKMKELGYAHIICCNNYGINIVASKFPIDYNEIINLGKDPIKKQNRYCVYCKILGFDIYSLHLDVYDESENTRLLQIKKIINKIKNPEKTIILGDFNSLSKKDYTNIEWNLLCNDDIKRGVVTQTKVTDELENNNFIDSFHILNKIPPKVTVWSMRRVDYIYLNKNFGNSINNCFTYQTLSSDHFPIIMDIKYK